MPITSVEVGMFTVLHTLSSVMSHYYMPPEQHVLQNKSAGWQLDFPWMMSSKSVWRDPTMIDESGSLIGTAEANGFAPGQVLFLIPCIKTSNILLMPTLICVCFWQQIKWMACVFLLKILSPNKTVIICLCCLKLKGFRCLKEVSWSHWNC